MAKSLRTQERERGVCDPLLPQLAAKQVDELSDIFKALADPTRLQIVASLRGAGEVCVCDCTASFDVSQPTISHHLAKLRDAGLLVGVRRGVWMYYRLNPDLSAAAKRIITSL